MGIKLFCSLNVTATVCLIYLLPVYPISDFRSDFKQTIKHEEEVSLSEEKRAS